MRSRLLLGNLVIALLLSGAFSYEMARAASPTSIMVDVSPENPNPNQKVNISLSSYANNLDSVPISWTVDGSNLLSGIGKTSFSLVAPGVGKESRVVVVISLPDGEIQKVIIVRPTIMTLLWQANDSYVPPFYKGKAMPTADSEVKIVAIPEIRNGTQLVNLKNLVYAWKKDYTNDPNASGYGKNAYVYVNDYLEESDSVTVTATTTDQKYSSQATITVPTYQPKILFYKNDLALGTLWETNISDGYRIQGEEIVEASPYFISPDDIRVPSILWQWSINDTYVGAEGVRKNVLPLRAEAGATGSSVIKLLITNKYKLFSEAKAQVRVEF